MARIIDLSERKCGGVLVFKRKVEHPRRVPIEERGGGAQTLEEQMALGNPAYYY